MGDYNWCRSGAGHALMCSGAGGRARVGMKYREHKALGAAAGIFVDPDQVIEDWRWCGWGW